MKTLHSNLLQLDLYVLIKHNEFLENCIGQFMVHSTWTLDVAPNTNTYTQNFKPCLCAKLK